jgi:two-component system NtrC family sensor kinase
MQRPHIPWWNRLGVKLAAAIALVSIATLSLFVVLMIRSQKRHLVRQALHTAAIVSDTISRSIHNDMLVDRRDEAYRMMEAIGRQEQIERLRVLDGMGQIRYSRNLAEIGSTVDLEDPSCFPCHRAQLTGNHARLTMEARTNLTERNGVSVAGAITPIYNEPACSNASCHAHPASQAIIGVIDLGLSLDAVERESTTLRRSTVALSLGTTIVLSLLTLLFVRRLVIRPVMQLMNGMTRVAGGDLRQVPVQGSDELAVLETSFNEMGRALGAARTERDALMEDLERQVVERTEALERAQAQLIQTEKLSSLGRLSASIAHEINNPLTGILTIAKLLLRTLDEPETPEKRAGSVRRLGLVQREAERCSAIVRNLLGFARERPLTVTQVDLNAVVEEALFLAGNQIALQGIELVRQFGTIPPVEGDFGQVRQALANVILNACDAMASGGTLRIETRHLAQDGIVEIVVSDTGVGIPREELSKVFDPFFTTKEMGTGLGLSVVYGIVERHSGRLTLESEVGVGTIVRICLPVAVAERVPTPDAGDPSRGSPGRAAPV